uniref:Uncharacterized protein n=1 Tax=Anguilla anguilla TaxID=7936 RepID=A0A0E9TG70_ANGAN
MKPTYIRMADTPK